MQQDNNLVSNKEVKLLMVKLKRKSCCCGGTEKTPCVCMLKGVMQCSAKAPKCPCYALLDKQKKKASKISKMVAIR